MILFAVLILLLVYPGLKITIFLICCTLEGDRIIDFDVIAFFKINGKKKWPK